MAMSNDYPDTLHAADQFLQFCRKAWASVEGKRTVPSTKNMNSRARPDRSRTHQQNQIDPRRFRTNRSTSLSPRVSVITPPGFKISKRKPKPGEPPMWGIFIDEQKAVPSSSLQQPRKKQEKRNLESVKPLRQIQLNEWEF